MNGHNGLYFMTMKEANATNMDWSHEHVEQRNSGVKEDVVQYDFIYLRLNTG